MFIALSDAVAATCGGKAGALGTLRREGLPVPDGFVLPFETSRRRPEHADLVDQLARGLHALGDVPVAVRSSAAGEDTAEASAAGQYESVLAVQGPLAVADAVHTCWASLHSPRAQSYRSAARGGGPPIAPAMAVLIQHQVDAEVSGVLFTPSEAGGVTRIEASWGLGTSVVGGTITPDRYAIEPDGPVLRAVATKQTRMDRDGSRLLTRDVPAGERDRATIDDAMARRLADLGQLAATVLGAAQDVEWALADGEIHLLQARPVTVEPPPPPPPPPARARAPAPAPAPARPFPGARSTADLTGTPASGGRVTGTARIVRGQRDFAVVRPGDILICPTTDPAWTPLLRIAGGVITATGGVLCHAAIIAREQHIPAVVGVPDVMTRIADGTTLALDGGAGAVTITHP